MATVRVSFHGDEDYVYLDDTTIKNLEIFSSSYESTEKYSLFGVINTTQTGGGGRLLRTLLHHPLRSREQIKTRQEMIAHFQKDIQATRHIHHILGMVIDIPRITSLIVYRKTLP